MNRRSSCSGIRGLLLDRGLTPCKVTHAFIGPSHRIVCVLNIHLAHQIAISTSPQRAKTWVEHAIVDIARTLGRQGKTTGHMCTLYNMVDVITARPKRRELAASACTGRLGTCGKLYALRVVFESGK